MRFSRQHTWLSVVVLMFLLLYLGHPASTVGAAPAERPALSTPPAISLNVPAEAFLGTTVNFTVTFDNPGTAPGYGPLIDLVIPTNGPDGAPNPDGLTFINATYLGVSVERTVITVPGSGTITHPYMVNSTGAFVTISGLTPGDTFVALRLPFGSFTPDQPPLSVDVTVSMSNLADLGTPLTIRARGGYQLGYTPLNDWCCGDDPSLSLSAWVSDSVTPTLFTLSKSYNGPEDETATGPNFPRQYTVSAQIAPGQTMTSFNLTDALPDNMQFVSLVGTSPGGASCTLPSTSTPGGTLSCNFGSVSGTVSMTFAYYIPLRDAGGASVIDPLSGDDALSCNNASGGGAWTPLDPRDSGGVFAQNPAGCEHTLTDKSIAIQKSVSVVGGGGPAPGRYLEYTLDFQISDFFAFNNIVVTDVISDGQRFDPTFVPTLQINGNSYTLPALAMQASNINVLCDYSGASASPPAPPGACDALDSAPASGQTTLVFDVSKEIIARGQDGRLIGGCVPTSGTGGGDPSCGSYNDGPTTGRIVFRTLIQQDFSDDYPSGDPSVDQGDTLEDGVRIEGDVLSTSDASTPTGQQEDDASAASVSIGRGGLTKAVYAVNGSTSFGTPVEVKPGDTVTFRLTYTLPTGDVENLYLHDYLPLPVFLVTDPDADGTPGPAWTFSTLGGIPAAGVATFGPADTFYAYSSIVPTLTANSTNNRLEFDYGNFDGPTEQTYTVDILFTVAVTAEPFADRLYLTNQANAFEGSTNAGTAEANAIVQIILTEPVLNLRKGVIWTDNPTATFSPTPPGPVSFLPPSHSPRWSGTIHSTNLAAQPINSNLSGVDAGDIVTFAIVIENTGSSLKGAFDIDILDTLPAGFQIPGSGLNLQIYYGNGTGPITYTRPDGSPASPSDLFGPGIRLVDPVGRGVSSAYDPNLGNNVILITYDLEASSTISPGAITNTGTIVHYAGAEGGPNHVPTPSPINDDAVVQVRSASLGKTFTTEIVNSFNTDPQAVIGELVDYTLTITVPEGQMTNVTLEDTLPAGLAFVDCLSIAASSDVATDLVGGFAAACNDPTNPSVSTPGQNFTFTLGTITNANRNNSVHETITIVFRAVVLNVLGNQAGTTLRNTATLRIDGGAGGIASVQSDPLTVIEPTVNTVKTVSPGPYDAGDRVTFTVTLSNPSSGSTTAYDVSWSDPVPSNMTYVAGSLALGTCTASTPPSLNDSGAPVLTASGGLLQPGQSCQITFQADINHSVVPGQTITNTAQTRWTSLPGNILDRSTYNAASDERTGEDGLLGSGVLNDYRTQGQVNVAISNIAPTKYLFATSEAHTGPVGGIQRVTIGEIIRYRLVVRLPEGTSVNFQIQDYLPPGLIFLNDDTAKAVFVSDESGITSSAYGTLPVPGITDPDCFLTGNFADGAAPAIPAACDPLADNNVGSTNSTSSDVDTYTTGADPYFKLGTLINNDSDADAEYVIVEFNALVDNTAAGSNDAGDTRTNFFRVFINNIQNGPNSNSVGVVIAEPYLTLSKSAAIAPTRDAGDAVTYALSITAASGVNRSTAFDLTLTDAFDSYLTSLSVASVTTTQGATCVGNGSGTTAFSYSSSFIGNTLTFTASCLDPGRNIIVTVTGTLVSNVPAGYTLPNVANLVYTSLPGPNGTTSNPTGSSTPGASGSGTGERDGSGGINDYAFSANASLNLNTPQVQKQAPTPTAYPIGATVAYPIRITLPEGVTRNVRVTDQVPAGMQYVSYALDTSGFNGAVPAPSVSGGASDGDDVTFNFGDITTADDNLTTNNAFTLYVILRVLNVPGNAIGTVLTNGATLTYTPGIGATDSTISGGTQNITVIEPILTTAKSVAPPSGVQAGDTLTYTVRFTNTGTATAYDVTAQDILAQGVTYNNDAACVFFNGSTSNPIGVTVTVSSGVLTFDGNPAGAWDIPATDPDSYIECTYTATAQSSLHLDGDHTNTVDADWSSLDGPDPNERVYDDSVHRPGVDGTQDTASATFASPAPSFDKSDTLTQAVIGQTYTVTLTLTSPLGTLRNLTVTDLLPAGLIYVVGSQSVSGGVSPAPTFTVSSPNDGSLPVTLTWTFGDAVISSSPITFTYTVRVANVAGNQNGETRTNTATLSYTNAQGAPRTQTDSDDVTIAEPELDVQKAADDPTPAYGQTLTYTITVSHLAASTAVAYDLVITDVVPSGLTYVSGSITAPSGCTADDSAAPTLTWACASLPIGNTLALTYQATVNGPPGPPNPGDTLTNNVALTWTSLAGPDPNERDGSGGVNDYRDATSQVVILYNPDLTVTKTDGQTTYIPGLSVTYTIVVSNVGNGDVTDARVSDPIPSQVASWEWTCTTTGGATCNGSGGPITTDFTDTVDLPAGSSITYTVVANIASSATGNLVNTVTVSPPTGVIDPTPANNTATDIDEPNIQADLSITKDDGTAQYVPGSTLTYTVTVSNAGPSDAPNATVSDPIPAQIASWTWTCQSVSGGASGCDGYSGSGDFTDVVNLPAGASITYQVAASIRSSATGDLTNTATVAPPSSITDPDPNNNTATDTDSADPQAALSVTKDDGVTQYVPGSSVTYTITVTNSGPSDALGVVVSDPIPSQVASWEWTCTTTGGATCNGSGGPITTDFTDTVDMPAGSTITYTVVANIASSATGNLVNTVTITHPEDTTPGDNQATDTDTQDVQVDLYVTKTDGQASYTPGVGLTYTVVVGNNGPSDAIGAQLTDIRPSQVSSWTWTCVGATGGASGCDDDLSNPAVFTDTVDLPAGSTITYQVTVVIPSSASGTLTNTVEVDHPEETDPRNNQATDTDTQESQVNLSVTKDDGVTQYVPGSSVTYTITVTNSGPSDALGVVVSDPIPSQVASWEWACTTTGGATCSGSGGFITTDFTDTVNMPAGSTITYTVVANIASSATGNLVNTVTVAPPTGVVETDPTDNQATDTDSSDPQANLSITKDDGVTVVAPGSIILYTITVSNAGPSDALGAQVSDARPPEIVSWTWVCAITTGGASGCDGDSSNPAVFTDTVNLPAGSSITYQVTATIADTASGDVANTASVEPPAGVDDPDPTDNVDDDVDSIITTPAGDLSKSLIGTNQGFTPGRSVAIGEIVTYRVQFTVPAGGAMPDLTLTDVLDRGLAFVRCVNIRFTGELSTSLPGGFDNACDDPTNPTVHTQPSGSTNPADPGRGVVFSFGDVVNNSSSSSGTVTVEYEAVVLNSLENQDGLRLDNAATLRWASGSLQAAAPEVVIVEPDLFLRKEVDQTLALPGTVLTFTLTLGHTPESNVNAYDVVLIDILPPELTYVPGSLRIITGPAGGTTDDSAAPTLRVTWPDFPLLSGGQRTRAVVEFQATLGNLRPGQKVENEAALAWTSLPGDYTTPQSPYNALSTERFFDPPSNINVYGVFASVEIRLPYLPDTGFAPGVTTSIPPQPPAKTYQNMGDLWLEIPRLGVKTAIVGIPAVGETWDITWLWNRIGWLNGTAFPTYPGNSALTGHVYLPDGTPGPFLQLGELRWGDQVIVHLGGQRYVYEVREVRQVSPYALSPLRSEKLPWLTLITCREYDERSGSYRWRIVVRAVLIRVEPNR